MVLPSPRNQPFHRPPGPSSNPFMFPNQNAGPTRQGLPSLLGKFTNQQGSVGLINKGVGGLSSTLNNVQQVLKVVQSTAPIVQEYGPMVKNLPSMYRMMKAFKDMEADDKESKDAPINLDDQKKRKEQTTNNQPSIRKKKETSGDSKPILFF